MNFFATVAAMFALAGAPAGTPVTCSPLATLTINGGQAWGYTTFVSVDGATAHPTGVVLAADLCHNLHSPYPPNRAAALYGLLHEVEYLAIGRPDECGSDAAAGPLIPAVVAAFFQPKFSRFLATRTMADSRAQSLLAHGCGTT